jgi:chromate transporter
LTTVSFAQALRYWLRLGCISFGGPAGQIAIMHRELVEQHRWISEKRFLHALNYCMLLPGPEAQQLATYIGWLMHGVRGGIAAGVLFVLPSLLVLIALSWAYLSLGAAATDWLYGVKPAVVAVIAFAAWRIGSRVLRRPLAWAIALAAFGAVLLRAPFPAIIAVAAVVGWLGRRHLAPVAHGGPKSVVSGPALINDDQPLRHTPARLARTGALGVLLWALPLWVLADQALFAQIARFFTQAALVTFGGAYAVMPYVFQNAVETYGWLTPAQMLDGLALGETTPGPLIMVVAFIGFVSAWDLGPAAAILGACVATYFTFLPSFVFILAGAPLVERSRSDARLDGPLSAVTAAVLGAILHLALYLAMHVIWPQQQIDLVALALAAAALLALQRQWLGMIPVILLSTAAGAAWKLLGA